MEIPYGPGLGVRSQIDQDVAAADKVQVRERGVFREVVFGENAQLPDILADLIMAVELDEEALQSLLGEVRDGALGVFSRPGAVDGRLEDVRGEDLNGNGRGLVPQELHEGDGERIRFLPRRAAGHPEPDRPRSLA